jgi:hypothetical protein
MEQLNFCKQKLYALIAAGVGFIAMFLPWWSFSFGGLGGLGGYSVNGMHELGILAFLGFVGAGVLCFLGDKTKPFEGQFKWLTLILWGLSKKFMQPEQEEWHIYNTSLIGSEQFYF